MSQNKMKIRNSDLFFRSSSSGSSMEGIDVDMVSLDEYDRLSPLAEQSPNISKYLTAVFTTNL